MMIELPGEIENQLRETARAQGVSVGQYMGMLVAETYPRHAQIAHFSASVSERMALPETGGHVDGEEGMARLIAEFPRRQRI
jgi:hypothetical protein